MDVSEHEALVRKLVKPGDTLTHTRCMGIIEEHIYTGNGDRWLCGKPTRDTLRLGGSKYEVNDITPTNVTHINRVPVAAVELLSEYSQAPHVRPSPSEARGNRDDPHS